MLHLALLALAPAQRTPAVTPEKAVDPDAPQVIYYDYVEDGVLRGGRIPVDPGNPLHAQVGPELRASGSPVVTLLDNGPSANRIDIVVVGDGYTAPELGQYASDVDAVWPTFLAEPPLSTYASYFNVHRVDVVSPESGVDNDPSQGIQRNTALDMGYWCGGIQRLLCVNVSKAIAEASNAPDRDAVLALANSATYGGAGYSSLSTLSGRNGSAIEIALHEFGHSFSGLADEYHYSDGATYTGAEPGIPNVTTLLAADLAALQTKWYRWLDVAGVGTFEGAMYEQFGLYRPTNNSKMRSLGRPFQVVNRERLIFDIYEIVRPIDDATPPGRHPLDTVFFVTPLQPIGHSLDVQWSLDGRPIAGATGPTLDAGALGLRGPHVLSVEVADNTPMVRDPGFRYFMSDRRSWLLSDGKIGPQGTPTPVAGPVLTLVSGGVGTGSLELELDLRGLDPLGTVVPVIQVGRSGVRRTLPVVEAGGDLLPLSVALPRDGRLADRMLDLRVLLVPLDGRAPVHSAPLAIRVAP
jgi:hypothetical protein